jgi:phosphoenolpyruvate carboxykinase (ATP)
VPSELLDPKSTWDDPAAYDEAADKLAAMFQENAATRHPGMTDAVRAAGPKPLA